MVRRGDGSIDRNAILTLHALLDERSVTGAARRLFLSPQAVSGALARLRQHYDDELLERVGRDYRLTAKAETLKVEIDRVVFVLDSALRPADRTDPAAPGRLYSIMASDHALGQLAGPVTAVLTEVAPEVTVRFDTYPDAAADFPAQLLVTDIVVAPTSDGLPGRCRELLDERLVCVVSESGRVDEDAGLTIADLESLPMVSARRSAGSAVMHRVLDEAGVRPERHTVVANDLILPFVLAEAASYAFVPESVARGWTADLGLTHVSVPFDLPRLVHSAYWHPSRDGDAAVQWLIGILVDAAKIWREHQIDDATSS
ncbi:LysR family transcriptional regulator [Rhodococcus sp. NPDC076796]|uniref:LysR family transcriptional regulator n=1 Tax=Rhodococcus sp. NPDC076796 TaxID=3154859 RepID=UPI003450BDC0